MVILSHKMGVYLWLGHHLRKFGTGSLYPELFCGIFFSIPTCITKTYSSDQYHISNDGGGGGTYITQKLFI